MTEASVQALLAAVRAARRGDLTQRLSPGDDPPAAELAREWNGFMDDVSLLTRELTQLSGEVAGDGRFGGRARVPAARGAWRELSGGVNRLVWTMTEQFRAMAAVARAVARGQLDQRITVEAQGEVLELKNTINAMVDKLQTFGAEVARVSKELDAEGELRGPAPGDVSGLWKEFSENVNLAEQVALVSRHKSEFLANMSHEVRTPLNSLLILAGLLAENAQGNLTARQVEYARTIHEAGSSLLTLINEILDLSKLAAGKMRVELRQVRLEEVAAALERTFRPVAEKQGLTLTVELASGAPESFSTDPQRLHQVLRNLLSNALKFTERGGVTLRIAPADGGLTFAVSDTGIGVSPDQHALIFEPFQQADGSTARRYGGTGLGLSISRGFARLLGGDLRVESAPGQGSTFTLSLPAGPARLQEPQSASPAWITSQAEGEPASAQLSGLRVLVVDDDVRNVFALASVLEAQQMELLFAENGRQSIEVLEHDAPVDVVLMDIMMPELDGLEVMRRLRRDPRYVRLPIIAVTARAFPEDRQKCLEAGASAYLTKPVDTPRLLATIRQSLGL
jgi:signal transduction histidine kinase/CheY-like chemotaxis protein